MAINKIKKPNQGFGTAPARVAQAPSTAKKLADKVKQVSNPTYTAKTPVYTAKTPAKTSLGNNAGLPSTPTKAATQIKATPSTSIPASLANISNPKTTGTITPEQQAAANGGAAASGGAPASGGVDPSFAGNSAFAKSITELGRLPLMSDPSALARAWFEFGNKKTDGGLLSLMQNNVAPSLLLYHTLFGNQDPTSGTGQWGPYADFSDQYMNRAMTPGGAYYTTDQIVNALHPTKTGSPLIYEQLYGDSLTPAQQAYRWSQAYGAAAAPNTAEEVLSAQMGMLNSLGEQFTTAKARGEINDMNFGDWLAQNGWG